MLCRNNPIGGHLLADTTHRADSSCRTFELTQHFEQSDCMFAIRAAIQLRDQIYRPPQEPLTFSTLNLDPNAFNATL